MKACYRDAAGKKGGRLNARRSAAWACRSLVRASLLILCSATLGHAQTAVRPVDPAHPAPLPSSETGVARPTRSWFQRAFRKPSWEQALAECQTPEDVCRMVERNIGYRLDDADHWQRPQETWERGMGDCEDFAACIQEMCRELGFPPVSLHLYFAAGGRGDGHVVTVGLWCGEMWMSDVGDYREVDSIEDVTERVSRDLECHPRNLWSSELAYADVQRFLDRSDSRRGTAGHLKTSTQAR